VNADRILAKEGVSPVTQLNIFLRKCKVNVNLEL